MSAALKTQIASEWAGGFVANLTLTNSATAINNWTVEFDAPFEIVNIWNAQVLSHVGGHYVLQGLFYNASVAADGVVNFGFQAAQGQSASISHLSVGSATADPTPYLTVWDMDIGETLAGTHETSFAVELSQASATPVTVSYATQDGTARDGLDYIGAQGTLTFAPGETRKTIAISIIADNLVEGNETFSLNLGTPTGGAVLRKGTGTVTVHDDTPPPQFSVGNAAVTEPASGSANAAFTITMSKAAVVPVTIAYATQDASAKAGSDYAAASGTVTFAAGETSKVVNVAVNSDAVAEVPETFVLRITNPSIGNVVRDIGTATITDPTPAPPSLSVADVSLAEPVAGTANASFTVSLSRAATETVTVAYATADGTARAGADYAATSGTLTFAPGETNKTVSVSLNADALAESTETFVLSLSGASNATIAQASGTGSIADSGLGASFAVGDATVAEPASGSATASFVVTLSRALGVPMTVGFATADGTAHAGTDYTATSGTLTFAAGETSKTVTVAVQADAVVEGSEGFTLNLAAPSAGSIADASGAGTILDGTAPPTLSVGNVVVTEPGSGSTNAVFTVTLSKAAAVPVTVGYTTQDGTALAGSDYTATSGTLTFAAGETSKTISVAVNADAVVESAEGFSLKLLNPTIATLAGDTGLATVLDALPSLSVADISLTEPSSGTANAVFTLSLSQASSQVVTVNYATADGSAHAGTDYAAASGSVTFAPGETSKTVAVAVNADALAEASESFALNLSGLTNALYARPAAVATITDAVVASFSVNDATVTEPASGTANARFTVTLAQALAAPVTVDYDAVAGTAAQGADFLPSHGTLTFAAGETSKTVDVAVKADNQVEGTETFTLQLSTPSAGRIADASGLGTILDAAAPPSFSVNDVTVTEPASGTASASFTVSLAAAAAVPVTVAYTTADGTALAGSDYTATSGTLTFAAGETSKTVTVAVRADAALEATEAFALTLSAPSFGTLAKASGTATVQDLLPALAVGDATAPASGTTTETFTITLSKPSDTAVTVHYATADGTATAGIDYIATSGTLSFAAGETSKTVAVTVQPNAGIIGTEQFSLVLSAPTAASLADASGTGGVTYTAPVSEPTSLLRLTETVRDDWGQGFVADFAISNSGPAQNNWTVSFDFASDLVNIWNARVVSHVGSHYVLAGLDYDANLPAGGEVTFGFQANGASGGISQLLLSAGGTSTGGTVTSGDTGGGGGTGGSTGGDTGTGGSSTPPTLAVHNAVVVEPADGSGTAHFAVTLSHAHTSAVTVDYATVDGTATAGSDYTASHGSITFAAGETTKQVDVTILADAVADAREAFTLLLSNGQGAGIADASGTGTILEASQSQENPGWLHTDGNQIVNDAGVPVQLNSVSWFGFESANFSAHGLWTRDYHSMMDQMVELGFNSIRLPYADQMFDAASKASGIDFAQNPDLVGLSPLEILDRIVAYADQIGLKIVLDHHRNSAGAGSTENGLWFDSKYSEADMIRNWEMLADRYGDNPSVIGADLHNEPHAAATWGTGAATDWDAAAERIGDAVLAHAPNWLIFVEGIGAYNGSTYWWGGDLEGAKDHPVDLSVANRLVYSPHDYPNSIYPQTWFSDPNYPANEPEIFSQKWGYLYEQDIAPLWIGEWGTKLTDPKDVQWAQAITEYLHGDTSQLKIADGELGPSWSWWAWNPNSGDTGGILKDDWLSVNLNKIELLQPLMYGLIPTDSGSLSPHTANAALGLTDQAFTGGTANDVLFRNDSGATWFWEVKDGAIAHQGAIAFLNPSWTIIGSGDTDASGKAEILVRTPDGFFGMWQLDDNLQGHYVGSPGWLDSSWTALQMKDFNGDGMSDVLFRHETDNSYWTWQLDGSTVTATTNLGTGPAGASYAGAGDFNGDGKADVVWRGGNGTLSISFSDGESFATTKDIIPQAPGWSVKGVADFNGDGKTDLLLGNDLGVHQIWEMAGNIVTKVDDLGYADTSWQLASVGDLNGDARADILWLNSSGELWAWNMNGGQIASQGSMGWVTADWHVVGA